MTGFFLDILGLVAEGLHYVVGLGADGLRLRSKEQSAPIALITREVVPLIEKSFRSHLAIYLHIGQI